MVVFFCFDVWWSRAYRMWSNDFISIFSLLSFSFWSKTDKGEWRNLTSPIQSGDVSPVNRTELTSMSQTDRGSDVHRGPDSTRTNRKYDADRGRVDEYDSNTKSNPRFLRSSLVARVRRQKNQKQDYWINRSAKSVYERQKVVCTISVCTKERNGWEESIIFVERDYRKMTKHGLCVSTIGWGDNRQNVVCHVKCSLALFLCPWRVFNNTNPCTNALSTSSLRFIPNAMVRNLFQWKVFGSKRIQSTIWD